MAVSVLAQAEGRSLAVTPLVELAARIGLPTEVAATPASLLLPTGPPPELASSGRAQGWVAQVGAEVGEVLMPVSTTGDIRFAVVAANPADDAHSGGIDPEGALVPVSVPIPSEADRPGDWSAVLCWIDYYLANAVLGAVGAMIDLAREHVTVRHQFGVPLGSFQAVQHRLADAHVTWEAAQALVPRADRPQAAEVAMLVLAAHEAFEVAARECTQVMGAIACTWEHPLHRFVRRGLALLALASRPRAESAVAAAIGHDTGVLGEVL